MLLIFLLAASITVGLTPGRAEDTPVWEPLSSDITLNSVVWGEDRYVAVGVQGTILMSTDGSFWQQQVSGTTGTLQDAAWGGGAFVAVGQSGTVLRSLDGASWVEQKSNTNLNLTGVAWGGELFVAVGSSVSGGHIFTSPDGEKWTEIDDITIDISLNAVAWCSSVLGSVFVAVGDHGVIMVSPDGETWVEAYSDEGVWLRDITSASWTTQVPIGFVHRIVVVGGNGVVLTSDDLGATWQEQDMSASPQLLSVAYAPNPAGEGRLFLAVGAGGVMWSSTNGFDWTQRFPSVTSEALRSIVWGDSLFVMVGANGTLFTSSGGDEWDQLAWDSPAWLIVYIWPVEARGNALWSIAGESYWYASQVTIKRKPGDYTITFNDVEGWTGPDDIEVTLVLQETVTVHAEYSGFPPGDINGDGKVDALDAVLLLRHLVELTDLEPEALQRAKVTEGDGDPALIDAILILQYAAGLVTELPVE